MINHSGLGARAIIGFAGLISGLASWNAIAAQHDGSLAEAANEAPSATAASAETPEVEANEAAPPPVEETADAPAAVETATETAPPAQAGVVSDSIGEVRAAPAVVTPREAREGVNATKTSTSVDATSIGNTSSAETQADRPTLADRLWMNYFNIFYGPSVSSPTGYQPTPTGVRDDNRPVLLENFVTLGYDLDERWSISGTGYFVYVPVGGQEIIAKDPYIKLSNASLLATDTFNLYGDVRMHLPVTYDSRQMDLLGGFQALVHPTYTPRKSRLTLGVWAWARYNLFGAQGAGDDFEVYLGPNLYYQLSSKLAFTVLLETGSTHRYGDAAFKMYRTQPDIEPGLSWDITPTLNFSPYLNVFLGEGFSLKNTGMGATMSWMVF